MKNKRPSDRLKEFSRFPTQQCPHCSSPGLEMHTMPMWVEIFGKKVPTEGEVLFCPNCDAMWLHPDSKQKFDDEALQYMVRLN